MEVISLQGLLSLLMLSLRRENLKREKIPLANPKNFLNLHTCVKDNGKTEKKVLAHLLDLLNSLRPETSSGRETKDGGYIISGATEINATMFAREVILVKLNSHGDIEWAKTIGGDGLEHAAGIENTPDKGFVIAGITNSRGAGSVDSFIAKLKSNGELEWAKAIGGRKTDSDNWDGIRVTKDEGYIICGESELFGVGKDLLITKLRKDGTLEWSKVIGGDGDDACWTVTPTQDGGYIAGGRFQVNMLSPNMDIPFVKLDSNGNFVWGTLLGDDSFQEIEEIKETEDGYILAGVTSGKFFIAKLNRDGLVPNSRFIRRFTPKITA